MYHSVRIIFLCICIGLAMNTFAQDSSRQLDSLYLELDSLFADESVPDDLFALADSILALENAKVSALVLRMGYVSQVVSAGRALGIDQFGISPAISYFHHSGLGGSVTGYWSSEYSPSYYLTDVSLNYSRTFKQKLTILANHDFYFYNDSLPEHSFNKSAQVSANYHHKRFDAGGDYAFLYGNAQAHRIVGHANLNFKLRFKNKFIDAITFMPGAALQWGNADVLYLRQPRTALTDLYRIIKSNDYPLLTRREYLKLAYLLETDRKLAAALFLKERGYTNEEIKSLGQAYYDGSYRIENTFGFMNWSVSMPVIIRAKRFSLLLNYTYNQPQSLPGEDFEYESTSYFSASLSYAITSIKK